jgi:outer membrane protein TolC
VEAAAAELLLGSTEAALAAAEANVDRAERHAAEGMVTEADVLQARAALEDARLGDITARQGVDDARARLALALGWPAEVVPVPDTEALTRPDARSAVPSESSRADLLASEARVRAASSQVSRADRARLPKVQAFARLEGHADEGFSARGDSWSVGLRLSVPLFTGFELGARRQAARAELDVASLQHDQMLNRARAALAEARRGLESRSSAVVAAEAAARSGLEAARLMRLRYEEGLATTAELLAVESAATRHAATALQARLSHRIAAASLLLLDDPTLHALSSEGVDR